MQKVLFLFFLLMLPGIMAAGIQPGMEVTERQERQAYYLFKPQEEDRPAFAGDRQHGRVGEVSDPLRAKVVNRESEPVIGMPVSFEVVSYPSGGEDYQFDRRLVTTDSSGMAAVNFRLGSAGGEYRIMARIRSAGEENVQFYTIFARERNWLLIMLAGLFGGLALFLFGLKIMSRGMLGLAGKKLRSILGPLAGNRIKAMGLGAFVTTVTQNSSTVNVMLGSFVNAGLMNLRQTTGVILGTVIGTTITAQVIAFRLTDVSLLIFVAGFVLRNITGKENFRYAGNIILGFGLLFFGMQVMSDSMFPLRTYDPFLQLLLRLEDPAWGILAGVVFTALIPGSPALVGILIIMSTQGLITLEAAIPLLFGVNIGIAVTSLVAGLRSGWEARKVALVVTFFKIFGVLLFVWWISPFANLIEEISPSSSLGNTDMGALAEVMPRQIANAHTLYNVFVALLVLPFSGLLALLADRLMPGAAKSDKLAVNSRKQVVTSDKLAVNSRKQVVTSDKLAVNSRKLVAKSGETDFNSHYLDGNALRAPVLALNLAKKEVQRMGSIVYEMTESIMPAFFEKDRQVLADIETKQKIVNSLGYQINAYLHRITRYGVGEKRVAEAFQMFSTVSQLELMADKVSSSLAAEAKSWPDAGLSFSNSEIRELKQYHEKTLNHIKLSLEIFSAVNLDEAIKMEDKYKEYRSISLEFEKLHNDRLKPENRDAPASSNAHTGIITILINISSHAVNIARILLHNHHPAS